MLRYRESDDNILVDKYDVGTETWGCWYYFLVNYDQIFPTYESYLELMRSVALNHENGMPALHFAHLVQSYATSIIINDLLKDGLITEEYTEDGQLGYRIHIRGLTDGVK